MLGVAETALACDARWLWRRLREDAFEGAAIVFAGSEPVSMIVVGW